MLRNKELKYGLIAAYSKIFLDNLLCDKWMMFFVAVGCGSCLRKISMEEVSRQQFSPCVGGFRTSKIRGFKRELVIFLRAIKIRGFEVKKRNL